MSRRRLPSPAAALVLTLLAAAGCVQGGSDDNHTINQSTDTRSTNMVKGPSMSRRPPRTLGPIEKDGIRYEQVMDMPGIDNRTGWLRATRMDSGEVIWTRQVYRHDIDPRMERDVQEFYFRSMELDPTGGAILIEDERGRHYSVDPASGESTALD